MSEVNMNEIAAKSLGDSTSYAVYTDMFDPSLLNPMPRSLARNDWGITGKEFVGYDVWNGYESTFLLNNGYPVAGTLKIVYSSSTEFMVESKSMKLYLNSFDMCKMGETLAAATLNYENQIASDLSKIVGDRVNVKFHDSRSYVSKPHVNLLAGYQDIVSVVPDIDKMVFDDYAGTKSYVKSKGHPGETKFFTNALRSRCRHTKQKDTGFAMIRHTANGNTLVDEASVFRQIVSLRELNEFHEFCCEKIYCEIAKIIDAGDSLCTAFLYSRRGSLDICPVRASSFSAIPEAMIDVNQLTIKVQGQ